MQGHSNLREKSWPKKSTSRTGIPAFRPWRSFPRSRNMDRTSLGLQSLGDGESQPQDVTMRCILASAARHAGNLNGNEREKEARRAARSSLTCQS